LAPVWADCPSPCETGQPPLEQSPAVEETPAVDAPEELAPEVPVPILPRYVHFTVNAWSYYKGPREVRIKTIGITELGPRGHSFTQYYSSALAYRTLRFRAHTRSRCQVTITWWDNRFLMRTYLMGTHSRSVTVWSPYN
ncbi:MAG TPA: hypothetical protein VGO93_25190, partial [Candidatus Xenobia bacterium]